MEELDPGDLGDIAYGLFEVMLNAELRAQGSPLFDLVEKGTDFKTKFHSVFGKFSQEYPELGQALILAFGSPEAIYLSILEGEGVIPSRTTKMYWIVQDAPEVGPEAFEDELAGKWLIFLPPEKVDEAWIRVRNATSLNELGISAKVSTAKPNPDSRDDTKVIYVYTADWRDEIDVMRVRNRLKELGFIDRLGYKRNIETFKGEYSQKGKRVTFYSA
jgi:Basophilic leukemia-expressed protein Bles03